MLESISDIREKAFFILIMPVDTNTSSCSHPAKPSLIKVETNLLVFRRRKAKLVSSLSNSLFFTTINYLYSCNWKECLCEFSLTSFSTFATTGLTALLFSSTNSGFVAPVPALSADSFVDSIGVNVHLTYSGTPYERFEDLIKLKESTRDSSRDGAYQEEDFSTKSNVQQPTG